MEELDFDIGFLLDVFMSHAKDCPTVELKSWTNIGSNSPRSTISDLFRIAARAEYRRRVGGRPVSIFKSAGEDIVLQLALCGTVIDALNEGLPYKTIAKRLGVTVRTVQKFARIAGVRRYAKKAADRVH